MTPYQASGAGQAVEDAYVLAAILANPLTTLETLPEALKVYEEIRLPHAVEVQRKSATSGNILMFHDQRSAHLSANASAEGESEVDPGKLWEVGHECIDLLKWAWATDVEDDKDRAIAQLVEKFDSC